MKTSTLRFRVLPALLLLTGVATLAAFNVAVKSNAAATVDSVAGKDFLPARSAATATVRAAVFSPVSGPTITVDTTLDLPGLSACTAAPADCSLRGAIISANANPGTTINVPAGTYLLTVPGAGEQFAASGDLDVRATGTSIVGAGAASTIIQQTIADRVFETNPVPQAAGFAFSISGVTIKDGSTTAAGGGILGGGPAAVTTITDCVFDNDRVTGTLASNGGAISFTSANTGDLIISGTTFTNNTTATGVGGAIRFSTTGTLTVTRSSFSGNKANTNSGGAINVTGPGAGGTYNISQSSFSNNQALGALSRGGAVLLANGSLNISFSRLVSNVSGSGIGTAVSNSGTGTETVNNNWWGLNSGPPAGSVFGTTATSWLQLRHVANPNTICTNGSTTLTADILGLNTGGSTAASNLVGLPAFPVPPGTIFTNAMNGSVSGASTQFVDGIATATFTAGATTGNGTVEAKADSETVIALITIQANTTSAPGNQAVCAGATATFSTTASGPGPYSFVWKKGATVLNNGDLGGRVTITSGGASSSISISNVQASDADTFTVEATGACSTASQSATLSVNAATSATQPADQTVCKGATASFSTTASGTGPFHYVWTVDGSPTGGDSASVNVATGSLSVGSHSVSVVVTGACGSDTKNATLTVQDPTTTSDPSDQTVCQGATANFSTTAGGTGPFHYAWTLDGSPFNGDSSSIAVPTGSLSVGNHTVAVTTTGTCGSASQSATLTVQANTATSDPADQTVCQGATANFSTTASGTGPFSYAWTVDGVASGGNSSSLSVATGSLSVSNHTVSVTTTGTCGSASQSATLTVQENTATSDPSDQTVCQGATANFSTAASGTGPFHYAWTLDGSPFNGDSSSIAVPTGSLSVGNHTVAVTTTGTCGSASQSAALTVQPSTTTSDPSDQTVCQGATANFSTTAGGIGPFHYAWTLDGSPFNGDSSSIAVPTGSLSVGNHTVAVTTTGTCGSASQSATLTVQENTATSDPADQAVCQGVNANFSTTATGTGPFHYAWTVDGSASGGDSASLSVATGSLSVGNHTVSVTTTGTCGSASQSATLTVQANTATSDPLDQTVCQGATANFSTTATGTGPFHYAWTLDGSPFNGDSSSIAVPTGSLSIGNHTVSVTTTGACGSASQSATLTVQENTTTSDPADQTVCPGTNANFSTTAGGTGPFHYAWTLDGSPFNGDSSSISIPTGSLSSGTHTVAVTTSGSCGSASQSATLTVKQNTATTDPPDRSACAGSTTSFSTTASGTGPFSFVWKKGATVLHTGDFGGRVTITSTTSGSTLTISNLQSGDFGTYTVETTGSCNTATQSSTLSVNSDPPTITLNGQNIELWPPNHVYHTITVNNLVVSASSCDGSVTLNSVVIDHVTSDEVENGNGDGNTNNDIVISCDRKSVQLRSERDGGGDGRVYTIYFKATDNLGHSTIVTAKVTVPKSQNGNSAIDSGPHYTVTNTTCP